MRTPGSVFYWRSTGNLTSFVAEGYNVQMDIPVTRLHELFDYDDKTGVLTRKTGKWKGRKAGTLRKGYVIVYLDRQFRLAHRIIWAMHNGRWPENEIDHINRIKDDNRIENLRPATHAQNCQNRNGKGVCWHKATKKWNAYVFIKRKRIDLGLFTNIDDALAARKRGVLMYYTHAET